MVEDDTTHDIGVDIGMEETRTPDPRKLTEARVTAKRLVVRV